MSMKKGDKELHWLRVLQKKVIEKVDDATEVAGKVASGTMDVLQKVDQAAGISEKTREVGGKVSEQTQALDERYGLNKNLWSPPFLQY